MQGGAGEGGLLSAWGRPLIQTLVNTGEISQIGSGPFGVKASTEEMPFLTPRTRIHSLRPVAPTFYLVT